MAPIKEWFLYADRDNPPYNPTIGDMITTRKFWREDKENIDSPDWISEEWFIISALISKEQLSLAAEHLSNRHLDFHAGWHGNENGFDFADYINIDGIDVYAWQFISKDSVSNSMIVELRQDFELYHLLKSSDGKEYRHPIDNLIVAEIGIDSHRFYDQTPRIEVQRDYLCDYLAARGMGLLISIVADRFANVDNSDKLDLEELNRESLGNNTWITTIIHESNPGTSFHLIRSTLWRNMIIKPYEKPKIERSPWPYYGKQPNMDEGPKFTIDPDGNKAYLTDHHCPVYLYFRPEVLLKYLRTPGFGVFFHMRHWGIVSFPNEGQSIDVGMNSKGLVNAFAPDIAKRNAEEQAYWASYSSIPSGEVCEELFQTRMQCKPPHSPGAVDLILQVRSELDKVFQERFSCGVYDDFSPNFLQNCKISVGPITNDFAEFFELTKVIYKWLIESMNIESLRRSLDGKIVYDKEWKQIKLLEEILKINGVEEPVAKLLSNCLRGLNELRVADAHISTTKIKKAFNLLKIEPIPENPRDRWDLCFDKIISTFETIISILNASGPAT